MFFIFIGNMKRVPEFYQLAQSLVGGHPLEVAVVSSQVISNVPTTLLLSGFCDQWRPLIIGASVPRSQGPLSGRVQRGERAVPHRARRSELDHRIAWARPCVRGWTEWNPEISRVERVSIYAPPIMMGLVRPRSSAG